jgi:PBP1b-binding outer membrane lipoprotein LpoB
LTLAKTGKINNLNLSSLLKSHLLDDDGIEDLHFYFVSFNHHRQGILKQHEVGAALKAITDKQQHSKHKKSNSSTAVNVKPNTNL